MKEIAGSVGVSSGTVHKILTQELKLRNVCARWVPHLLTKEQKIVWRKKKPKILTNVEYQSCLQGMKPGSIILSHRDAVITSGGCKKTKQGRSLPKELKA